MALQVIYIVSSESQGKPGAHDFLLEADCHVKDESPVESLGQDVPRRNVYNCERNKNRLSRFAFFISTHLLEDFS